jgi:hypothetical protein
LPFSYPAACSPGGIGRTRFTFNSSVMQPWPFSRWVWIAQLMHESSSVHATPPGTVPIGLWCRNASVIVKRAKPGATSDS